MLEVQPDNLDTQEETEVENQEEEAGLVRDLGEWAVRENITEAALGKLLELLRKNVKNLHQELVTWMNFQFYLVPFVYIAFQN